MRVNFTLYGVARGNNFAFIERFSKNPVGIGDAKVFSENGVDSARNLDKVRKPSPEQEQTIN
jgi:hypothetical protein